MHVSRLLVPAWILVGIIGGLAGVQPEPAAAQSPWAISPPVSDAEAAARVDRNGFEPRFWGGRWPANYPMNETVPEQWELDNFNSHPENAWSEGEITGNFTGTTDEILQWAAHKWGFSPDLFRAVAVTETWWRQTDGTETDADGTPVHQGGGIMAMTWSQAPGSFPMGANSTAFVADYFGATMRHYYEGEANWFNTVERPWDYGPGDMWGSIGAWYAGRWYTDAATWYMDRIWSAVMERAWERQGF